MLKNTMIPQMGTAKRWYSIYNSSIMQQIKYLLKK